MKYVGDESEHGGKEKKGLNQMDKTFVVEGARISYCIWEVEGRKKTRIQFVISVYSINCDEILLSFSINTYTNMQVVENHKTRFQLLVRTPWQSCLCLI